MKLILTTFFACLIASSIFSNPSQLLFDCQPFNWIDIEVELDEAEKAILLEQVFQIELFEMLKGHDIVKKSNFHFVNLNDNEHIDIIYYGFALTESNRTIFLENNGRNFNITIDLFGELKSFEKKPSENSFSFCILNYPCCAGYTFHLESYTYNTASEILRLDRKIAYIKGTKFPEIADFNKKFETVNEPYRLRAHPFIDNDFPDKFFTYYESEGNLIAEFMKGTQGRSIAEYMDDTGRVWWFVIISQNAKSENNVFHNGDNNRELYEFAGWMSSRFLKEL
jgi:hypothetical protein